MSINNLNEYSAFFYEKLIFFVENELRAIPNDVKKKVLQAIKVHASLFEKTYIQYLISKYYSMPFEEVIHSAFSIELLMISAYVKDDIIDNNILRNHYVAINSEYGAHQAILIADLIQGLSQKAAILFIRKLDDANKQTTLQHFNLAFSSISLGQLMTISVKTPIKSINKNFINKLANYRCGILLSVSAISPNIVSKVCKEFDSLYTFGKWFGILLQHRNDIEDFIGSQERLGTPILQDVINAQPNLVLSFLFQNFNQLTSQEKKTFNNCWGANLRNLKNKDTINQDHLFEIIYKHNVIQSSIIYLYECGEFAVKSLEKLSHSIWKDQLITLTQSISIIK